MLSMIQLRRRFLATLVLTVFSLGAAGCSDDDPTEPPEEEEPDILTVRITVGTNSVTWNRTTGATSGDLVIPSGTSTLTAAYNRPDGTTETIVTNADFELRIAPVTGSAVAWTPNGAFGGSLVTSGVTSGQVIPVQLQLFHLEEGHAEMQINFNLRIQ
jgi:hypothetical protein